MQQELTHNQVLVWNAFFDEEMNIPSLTDLYLVQIAWMMDRLGGGKKSKSKLEDFILKFNDDASKAKDPLTSMAASKSMWMGVTKANRKDNGN